MYGCVTSRADTVDLLVDLGTMMVALLTSTSDRERDSTRMPRADTSDLAETLVSLSRQLACVPTRCDALVSVTLGNTNDVDHFVLREDLRDGDLLLKVVAGELDLVGDGTTVQLDLHDVRLLLTLLQELHLYEKKKISLLLVTYYHIYNVIRFLVISFYQTEGSKYGVSSIIFPIWLLPKPIIII